MAILKVQTGDVPAPIITNVEVTEFEYMETRRITETTSAGDGYNTEWTGGSAVRRFRGRGQVIDSVPNLINKNTPLTGTVNFDPDTGLSIDGAIVFTEFRLLARFKAGNEILCWFAGFFTGALDAPAQA